MRPKLKAPGQDFRGKACMYRGIRGRCGPYYSFDGWAFFHTDQVLGYAPVNPEFYNEATDRYERRPEWEMQERTSTIVVPRELTAIPEA